jgi:hypothetical protein
MSAVSQAMVFGASIVTALLLLRLVTPQPYEKVGMPRLTFLSVDLKGYAKYALLSAFLFGVGVFVSGVQLPYWLLAALGLCFGAVNVALLQSALKLGCSLEIGPIAGNIVTGLYIVLNLVLLVGCIALPFLGHLWVDGN